MKKFIRKTMNVIGVVALFVGTIAIVPTSLLTTHQPNCPEEFLK